jgi:inorganic phosphate transporter, PiT family
MDWLSILLYVLTFIAVMLVSGNNLSVCVGPAVGSRIINKRFGMLLCAAGFSLGLIFQGSTMIGTVAKIMPIATAQLRVGALLAAVIIFVIAHLIRAPTSLSMSLVSLFAGFSIANGALKDIGYISEIVTLWVAAPLIAIVLAFYLTRTLNRNEPKNFWHRIQIYKILLIVLAFSTSYVLGANTIGLIVATGGFSLVTLLLSIAAIFVGTFFLGAGEIRRVSQEIFLLRYPNATTTLATSTILVEVATLLNIPLSNTQALASAVFGTGLSYKSKFITAKPFLITIASWIIASSLSFVIGLLIAKI